MSIKNSRRNIESIDAEIIKLIKKRMEESEKIGHHKKKHGMQIVDKKRETELYKKLDVLAKKLKLNQKMIKGVFLEIVRASRKAQKEDR